MKVSELKAGQGKVDIEVKVKSKADIRVFQKFGKELKVANAVVMDESGEIQMSLWNADADAVNVGDTLKITNGYVSEFNGTKQLTSGKFGKLEVVGAKGKHDSHPAGSHKTAHTAPTKETKKHESKKQVKEDEEETPADDESDFDDEDLDYEEKEF